MSQPQDKRREILKLVAEYHAGGLRPAAVRARRDPRPLRRPRVRCRRTAIGRRGQPRFLAHRRPLHRAVRERAGPAHGSRYGPAGQFRLVGQPGGLQRADLAAIEGPPGAAGRRSDHRGRRLPHDRQPDHPEPRRAGLRRRGTGDLRAHRRGDRSGHHAQDPGRDDRPHDGHSLRRQGRGRTLPASTASGWSRIAATPWGPRSTAGRWARSAIWPPCRSTRPTRSPWARAGPWSWRTSCWPGSPARSATGAATAIAAAARTTPAASASASSSARCPAATTTSTSIRTSATT